ncbi:VWA domain-containing protein [Nocardioides mangrovicus]|uniref:VWA domain-containing protein n=1 Tax=Nocardioides mangrovicus TaxID=2478913 RepID=A0A3L8NZ59_9ACTN|nr:VWA domain-containing protein [Nocardioides mangrovicus]RLV47942.1 VWA domain-containing protein [Nocardioides mangrovicus]
MSLLDRHVGLVEALRRSGVPVSLAEDLDAVRAAQQLPLLDRDALRAAYAATLVKRPTHRPNFDALFDLWFPPLLGDGIVRDEMAAPEPDQQPSRLGLSDGPEALAHLRDRLAEALGSGDPDLLAQLAREGVGRFGEMKGRGQGQASWSAYTALHRIHAAELVDRVVAGLAADPDDAPAARRRVQRRVEEFGRYAEADARRRVAEEKGADHMSRHAVRPTVENLDFTSARRADLVEMRRQIHPLARRLATRLAREQAAQGRGSLDFRRTVRASMSTGGVPLETKHRPRRPARTDLVVLCDVSGSVASFAQFTLMLVFALREQFSRVRAFTFVDEVTEVTDRFRPGADPVQTMLDLAASVQQVAMFGRTHYGRALERFYERHHDALGPQASLLVLGDARSNHSDLALPTLRRMVRESRHAWWLNPEHARHWDTGDSAASAYGEVVPMVECRNLTQLGEFVHGLAI